MILAASPSNLKLVPPLRPYSIPVVRRQKEKNTKTRKKPVVPSAQSSPTRNYTGTLKDNKVYPNQNPSLQVTPNIPAVLNSCASTGYCFNSNPPQSHREIKKRCYSAVHKHGNGCPGNPCGPPLETPDRLMLWPPKEKGSTTPPGNTAPTDFTSARHC